MQNFYQLLFYGIRRNHERLFDNIFVLLLPSFHLMLYVGTYLGVTTYTETQRNCLKHLENKPKTNYCP